MNAHVGDLIERIQRLEDELEAQLAKRRADLSYSLHGRAVRFEEEVLRRHRELKTSLARYVLDANPLLILTAPLIYLMFIPMALLDLCITVCEFVCFPVYGIEKVRRSDYFAFDRAHLAYLNALERINCAYCSYANGLFAYVQEIAARTEQYWCPIKHARRVARSHTRYRDFFDYGDAESYRLKLPDLRADLQETKERPLTAPASADE